MNHQSGPLLNRTVVPSLSSLADCIRNILASRNFTMYAVAAESRRRHPHNSSYHVPHNFYFQLQSEGLSPTLHQVSSLSELTGYRFVDWLRVFGFHLHHVPLAQARLSCPRTALLDARIQEPDRQVPWVRDRRRHDWNSSVAPLSQILEPAGKHPVSWLPFPIESSAFYYVKIGQQDVFAFPDLAAESIVRANPGLTERYVRQARSSDLTTIFLVEHNGGLFCSRLHFGRRDRITLLPAQLPFANVEFELGSQARILGVVDFELRPLSPQKRQAGLRSLSPEVPPNLARQWLPTSFQTTSASQPAQILSAGRRRAALSLRTASRLSREVAGALGDDRYFTSQGSLSDYEATQRPPRHIHKVFTLCILYALSMPELLKAYGFDLAMGAEPIPTTWIPESDHLPERRPKAQPDQGFLSNVLDLFGELPFFLCGSLDALSGLSDVSLNDVFWIGGDTKRMHPILDGGLFALIHRRKTTPPELLRKAAWERPVYLVLTRDGSHVLANCTIEGNIIVIHPHAQTFVPQARLRRDVDAEVVGQVVAVVRSVLSPRDKNKIGTY